MTWGSCSECLRDGYWSGRFCSSVCEERQKRRLSGEKEVETLTSVKCRGCGRLFESHGSPYCSIECRYRHGGEARKCPICQKTFTTMKTTYCSRACADESKKKEVKTGLCRDCGRPTSHKNHVLCDECNGKMWTEV
jgi:hypothetical protein